MVCEFLLSNKMYTLRAMRVNLQHKTNRLKFIRMKNLFTIIAASLLLGTASMAVEHTGIDNNSAYLDLRPNGTTLRTTAASRIVVCNVMGQMVANTEATEVSTAGWQPGLYIARQGNAVVKFVVK